MTGNMKYIAVSVAFLWLLLLMFFGMKGSFWLKKSAIEGPLWLISILISILISWAIFSSMHATRVINAFEQYTPGENDGLSERALIIEPGLWSFALSFVFLIMVYLVIGWLVYNFDFESMKEAIGYGFGNMFLYIGYSIAIAGGPVFFFIFLAKTTSKEAK